MLPARTVPAWAALKTLALSGTPFPTGVLQAVSKYSRSLCVSAADMAASEQVSAGCSFISCAVLYADCTRTECRAIGLTGGFCRLL